MVKTEWKSEDEIRYCLRDAHKISVLSCGGCASLTGTGGRAGIRTLRRFLRQEGKEVVLARVVMACCPEEIMKQAVEAYRGPIARSDALVVLSCAGGVKSAVTSDPPAPVVALLNSVGCGPVSLRDDPVARSDCTSCGRCVLTFTGGICPLSECAAKSKYGPCAQAPLDAGPCALDGNRPCVWSEIRKRGDLEALKGLADIHRNHSYAPLAKPRPKTISPSLVRMAGWLMAHLRSRR